MFCGHPIPVNSFIQFTPPAPHIQKAIERIRITQKYTNETKNAHPKHPKSNQMRKLFILNTFHSGDELPFLYCSQHYKFVFEILFSDHLNIYKWLQKELLLQYSHVFASYYNVFVVDDHRVENQKAPPKLQPILYCILKFQ